MEKFLPKNKLVYTISIVLLSFLIGILFDFFILDGAFNLNLKNIGCTSNLKFINPQPGCEDFENKLSKMESLQNTLEGEINGYLKDNKVERISVFSRDLNTQRFVGVNETDTFYMASLLKVPLAIAYYRLAEITPGVLDQEIAYNGTPDLYNLQIIQPLEKIVVGKNYSIKNLLYRALAYSDNTAAEILSKNFLSEDYLQKILKNVGLQFAKDGQAEDMVTAKSYAGVFRILYNSSFLRRESSNEILSVLAKSTFDIGATAKIPKDITVAHKFGERALYDRNNQLITRQLHDCGIVYAKKGQEPYTFCIMTQGKNLLDLEYVIQNISETIYKGITD